MYVYEVPKSAWIIIHHLQKLFMRQILHIKTQGQNLTFFRSPKILKNFFQVILVGVKRGNHDHLG